jgi:hypothetical protein
LQHQKQVKTKRTGPETRADALGEVLFIFVFCDCRSFMNAGLAEV